MVTTKHITAALDLLRAATEQGGGTGSTNIPKILTKMGTFAKAVALEEYEIDKSFAFNSGLIFPLIGINHLVTRGIMQPLERMQSGLPDTEKGAAAKGTADVAEGKPESFFEDADQHISPTALNALKECVRISTNVTMAEVEGHSIQSAITSADLQTAELGLRGLNEGIQKLATAHPEVEGLNKFATDMDAVSAHYSAFAQKLLPQVSTSLKQTPRS